MRTTRNQLTSTIFLIFACAAHAIAQEEVAKVELFGGYSYIRADAPHGRLNLHGWSLSLERNLNRVVALIADFDGVYGSALDEDVSAYSALFGPKFTARTERLAPFAHTLFGVVRDAEAGHVNYGFGMAYGGGLDIDVNRRLSVRLAQADYEYSRVDGLNHHNFRFAAGVVLKWGEIK
jgi:hypothetical protein